MTVPAAETTVPKLRGYFGIGVERASKPMNLGNLFRTAHAFGASFVFTVAPVFATRAEATTAKADTSATPRHLPFYRFDSVESMHLPEGCEIIGIEITETAVALPSFRHPAGAAYVLGGERTGLSPGMLARCAHVVRIPAAFSLNVATAGAVVLYDRLIAYGRFAERPLSVRATPLPPEPHVHGGPRWRRPRPNEGTG